MSDLPDDADQLKAMLLALQEANLAKDKLLQAQQEEMAEFKTRVELLLEQLNPANPNGSLPRLKRW